MWTYFIPKLPIEIHLFSHVWRFMPAILAPASLKQENAYAFEARLGISFEILSQNKKQPYTHTYTSFLP